MNKFLTSRLALGVSSALLAFSMPAMAANYAVIMTIGNYSNPMANLPGVSLDAKMARDIAKKMGVPESNILEARDQALSKGGIVNLLNDLNRRIGQGDNVMLYYSGHGGQRDTEGGKCSEGLITHDMDMLADKELTASLDNLAAKAGQLVMMNDSCFSGGAAQIDKSAMRSMGDRVPKNWVSKLSLPSNGRRCGEPINKTFRNLIPQAEQKGANMLYIAAAADNEVAHATSQGSAATLAWYGCLNAGSDRDGSGMLSGEEVRACAQRYLDENRHTHHITLIGNANLPVSFVGAVSPTQAFGGQPDRPVNASRSLEDLRAAASPAIKVNLHSSKSAMKIARDELALTVSTSESGYLSILHVGSDGKTFDLLFPNDIDRNNYLNAGETLALPRPSWRVKAGGPAGISRVLAIVSATPMNMPGHASGKFIDSMAHLGNSAFHGAAATTGAMEKLYVEATGVNADAYGSSASGRFGASEILSIQEF